ncbi:MAG: response regulator [Candidatus Heimdallarchaeaceae archaeon]
MLTNKQEIPDLKDNQSDKNNSNIRILHIDDDEEFLYMTKVFLEKFGKETIIVDSLNDPDKTIENLRLNKYDVIISDYYMPQELNCIRMLNEIRKEGICIPFIVLTGTACRDDVMNGLNNGADCVIQKGFDIKSQFTELVRTINNAINRR